MLDFLSSINIKNVYASTTITGATICGTNLCGTSKVIEAGVCLANKYLGTGATAVCSTTAGNALTLCGCIPTCFLGATATASDTSKLGGQLPAYYLNSGSTAICATCAGNASTLAGCTPSCFLGVNATAICATCAIGAKNLCGCIPASFLLSGGTAVCATTAGNALCLNGHTEAALNVCNAICVNGHAESALSVANAACLGGALANTYAPLANPNFTPPVRIIQAGNGTVAAPYLTTGITAGGTSTTVYPAINFLNSWQDTNKSWMDFSVRGNSGEKITAMTLDACGVVCANCCFAGSGAGLTGTASSLTAGCATTAGNALCLGGNLANTYAPLLNPQFNCCVIVSCFVGVGGCSSPSYYASGVSASGPVNASFLKANFYGSNQTSIHLNWDAADNYGIGSKSGNIVNLEGACNTAGGRTFNGAAVDFRVTGCICGSTCIASPITCGTTCIISPITIGSTCACSPIILGSTCVCGAIVCSNTCVLAGSYICATTSVLSGTYMCATSYLQAATCAIVGTCATIGTNILMTTGAARCIDWNTASTGNGSVLLMVGNTGLSCVGATACCGGAICIRAGAGGTATTSGTGGAGGILWLCGGCGGSGSGGATTGLGGAICMVTDGSSAIIALPSSCVTLYYCGNSRLCTVTNGICIGSNCGFGTDWVATSDYRLKTNIQPISNALSMINHLCGICYCACDDCTCEIRIGLIAQDVLKIIPEIVSHSQPNEEDMKYGICDEKLGLKYDKLTAVLVEAIKEQQKQINCLCCELNYWKNSNM